MCNTKKTPFKIRRGKLSSFKILISNLDMSYKNLSARANCSISLLCAFRRFFSSDVGTYFKSCRQTNKQTNRKTRVMHIFREKLQTNNNIWRGSYISVNWFSCCILVAVGFFGVKKTSEPEKNTRSKATNNNKLNPHVAPGWNRTQATLVGGERSHQALINVSSLFTAVLGRII